MRILILVLTLLFAVDASALTVVTRYVNTDCANNGDGTASSCAASPGATGAYTKQANAESDIQADYSNDIVTADVQVNVVCLGDVVDNQGVTWAGTTTDATRYIHIYADSAWRHAGAWNDSKYTIMLDNGGTAGIWIQNHYTRVSGLQVKVGPGSFGGDGIRIGNGSSGRYAKVYDNIVRFDTSSCGVNCAGDVGIYAQNDAYEPHIYNNIVIGWNYDSSNKCLQVRAPGTGDARVYNNTLRTCYTGIYDEFGSNILAKNNIVDNTTTCESGTLISGSDYNSFSCASATGSNSRTSQTFTFVNSGSFDLHLDAADGGAKGFGTDLSADANLAFSTDIDGDTRSGSWDIGADETTASTVTFTVFHAIGAL